MNIGDTIYYMKDGTVHSAPILSKMTVENGRTPIATEEQRKFWWRFGSAGTRYATCHGEFHEDEVYSSKKELLESL